MDKSISKNTSVISITELTKVAMVAAMYVVITSTLAVFSFGAIQLRLSEMFNYLALYHKRYVAAVALGVVIANFMSPTWVLDVPIGSMATLLVLMLCRAVTKNIKNDKLKITVTAVIFALSMFTVAGQLVILYDLPFLYTWLTAGLGELVSMGVGGIFIYLLGKKVDLTK